MICNVNNQRQKYAIITSLKKWYEPKHWFLYYINYFFAFLKYKIYKLLKKRNSEKYFNVLNSMSDSNTYVEINNMHYPLAGHKQLEESLLRGFIEENIPFFINEIADNWILLWVDKIDLMVINKLKQKGVVKNVVTVPTACKYDYKYLMWNFPKYDCIDASLVASKWIKDKNKKLLDSKYWHKIIPWASGVKLPDTRPINAVKHSCVCYYKRLKVDRELTDYLNNLGIKCYIIEYGAYKFQDWKNILKNVDFAIFYQDCHETQGLAMAEAWACNVPTFIKTVNVDNPTSPYLNYKAGYHWQTLEELKSYINQYSRDSKKFLERFSPYDYVKENLTDGKSVQNLVKIIDELGK